MLIIIKNILNYFIDIMEHWVFSHMGVVIPRLAGSLQSMWSSQLLILIKCV